MSTRSLLFSVICALASVSVLFTEPLSAEIKTICAKKSVRVKNGSFKLASNLVVISGESCPKGYAPVLGMPENDGASDEGSPASEGAEIYGDESSGDLNISQNFTLIDPNRQYKNITIRSGSTLRVPSGTVLRCTGEFKNFGTIVVDTYARGALRDLSSNNVSDVVTQSAHPGASRSAAANGEYGDDSRDLLGGNSSPSGLSTAEARTLLRPGAVGGGGGGASMANTTPGGGAGGGTLTVLCKDLVFNATTGVIQANGEKGFTSSGAGGGAGGILILGSKTRIENQGVLEATGANGEGTSGGFFAGGIGGGGGGGIIHLISKSIFTGIARVTGGSTYTQDVTDGMPSNLRGAGGQGGSLVGNGGAGGSVFASGLRAGGTPGGDGVVLETDANPANIF